MFTAFVIETMVPCGLHCILAHHRYLWKFMYDLIDKRGQTNLIPIALRAISCGYLAYQYESYLKCKGKQYDGSSTLKMIGNDCKLIEQNIQKFLVVFLKLDVNETWESKSFEKMRQINTLYQMFKDLAQDIRNVHGDKQRAESFGYRANQFFLKFKSWAGGSNVYGKPYLHIMREHFGSLMVFWNEMCNWGYGYFTCSASEHLNKQIKVMEMDHTNLDENRFFTIIRNMRINQFTFSKNIFPSNKQVTCSACHEKGHTKKNKSCPMHPSQPPIMFEESDNEVNEIEDFKN